MEKLTKFFVNNYKIILIISFVLLIISGIISSFLIMDSGMENMLPENNSIVLASKELEKEFDGMDNIIIIVNGEEEKAIDFMRTLSDLLKQEDTVNNIYYKMDLSDMDDSILLFMPTENYKALENILGFNLINTNLIQKNIISFIDNSFNKEINPIKYLSSDNNEYFLMFVKPKISIENYIEDREIFFNIIESLIIETKNLEQFKNKIDAGIAGGYFVNDYYSDKVAFDNFLSTALITLFLIIFFVVFSLKKIWLPLFIMFPLLLGTFLTAAFTTIVFEKINLFSASFAVLLFGLGIDFAIHIIARYQEERDNGFTVFDALKNTLSCTGKGIIIGALTSAVAFLAFIFANFKGFQQMGIISGVGIIITLLCMLIVIPSIILIIEKKNSKIRKKDSYFLLNLLGNFIFEYSKIIVIAVILLMIFLFIPISSTKITADLTKFYPENIPTLKWNEILQKEFEYDPDSVTILAENYSQLIDWNNKLTEMKTVGEISSILSYIPEDQEYKLSVLKRMSEFLGHQKYFEVSEISFLDLPDILKEKYIGKTGKFLIEITPKENFWEGNNSINFREEIESITPNITGLTLLMDEIVIIIKEDILKISVITIVLILIMLLLLFRKILPTAIAFITLIAGLYITFGLREVFGIELNILNLMAIPLIIGIGIDSSVHMTHRLVEKGKKGFNDTITHTGKAVIMTTITTLIAFGSLIFANHPGLSSLGQLVVLGMSVCLILNLFFLPALYKTLVFFKNDTV